MSVVHASGVRDSLAEVVRSAVAAGSGGNATLVIRDGTDEVVTFELGTTPFGAASDGVITVGGTPITASADLDGAAVDNFLLRDRDGTLVLSGSVTATGDGGDIEVSNTNIAENQDCMLDSMTYEAAP